MERILIIATAALSAVAMSAALAGATHQFLVAAMAGAAALMLQRADRKEREERNRVRKGGSR